MPDQTEDQRSKKRSFRDRCLALWDQIAVEQDHEKLRELIAELNRLLNEAEKDSRD